MPPASTHAVALTGAEGHLVEIHAGTSPGPAGLLLSGLPDTALRETRDRIRAAVINSGEAWPPGAIPVALTPASLPKHGSSFDLAIAIAILAAAGSQAAFVGELGLDGQLRPVRGVLPAVAAAAAAGFARVIVPAGNAAEAALVPGIQVIGSPSLAAVLAWLRGDGPAAGADAARVYDRAAAAAGPAARPRTGPDLADMAGQPVARQVAELCAAGGHHLLLLGLPGSGTTMLAERIPALLPPLDEADALEVTALHSLAGLLPPSSPLVSDPPFCSPHHAASLPAITGGGARPVRPGAVSLAHRGVLFLDEAPEFDRGVLDALRQPLDSGQVVLSRGGVLTRFPAAFILVLAASPCPCTRATARDAACGCSPAARRRYQARLAAPLLDRVDLTIELQSPSAGRRPGDAGSAEPSSVVAARVAAARQRAAARLAGTSWRLNAQVPGGELRRRFPPAAGAMAPLEHAAGLGVISQRAVARILGVAWTLADLAGKPRPEDQETGLALSLYLGRPA